MSKSPALLVIVALALASASAIQTQAQFAPPPGGGGDISLTPPTPVDTTPKTGAGVLNANGRDNIMAFRANQAYTTNALIGYVNDQPIFANDVFRPLDSKFRDLAAKASLAEFVQAAKPMIYNQLRALESDIIFVSAAQSTLTEQDFTKINYVLNMATSKLLSDNGGSQAAAEVALQKTGSSIAKELSDQRRIFIKQLYFQKNLAPRVQVTRQMALDAYEKTPKRWEQVAQIELFTITLPVSRWLREPGTNGALGPIKANPTPEEITAAEGQAMTTAREIIAKLKAGEDFARLVEDYDSRDQFRSKGGRRGSINKGSMVDEKLESFVFGLPADGIGPILLHDNNFQNSIVVVAKVGGKTDARTVPFTEAQATLISELRSAQLMELEAKEMERLSKNAPVEAVDRMIDVAVQAAVTRYATR